MGYRGGNICVYFKGQKFLVGPNIFSADTTSVECMNPQCSHTPLWLRSSIRIQDVCHLAVYDARYLRSIVRVSRKRRICNIEVRSRVFGTIDSSLEWTILGNRLQCLPSACCFARFLGSIDREGQAMSWCKGIMKLENAYHVQDNLSC